MIYTVMINDEGRRSFSVRYRCIEQWFLCQFFVFTFGALWNSGSPTLPLCGLGGAQRCSLVCTMICSFDGIDLLNARVIIEKTAKDICYFVNLVTCALAIFQLQASFSSRELCAVDLNIKSPHEEPGTSEPCDAGGKSLQKSLQGVWIGGNMCDAAAGEHKHVR